ncbi:ABC transporter substrate-binding protein [Paenibacillaceae bacterium]|nr:ABC transporter substrate-binding protein [Paenibacillaceae bacterium]
MTTISTNKHTSNPNRRLTVPLGICAVLLLALLSSACGSPAGKTDADRAVGSTAPASADSGSAAEQRTPPPNSTDAAKESTSSFPLTVLVDGEDIAIAAKPMRIAALSLDAAEAVLELVEPERIAVIAKSAADPALAYQAEKAGQIKEQISGATSLDPEKVMSYNTDLLVMTKGHDKEKEASQLLAQAGIPLISLDVWNTFDKIWTNYRILGEALDEQAKAEAIVAEMQHKLSQTEAAVAGEAPPSVLVISPVGPGTGPYLIGMSNISNDVVRKAGAHNMAETLELGRSTKASMEQIIKADPDYIVLLQWKEGETQDLDEITGSAGWNTLRAVSADQVKVMTVKQMLYPNRYVADTVDELARWFHPGKF